MAGQFRFYGVGEYLARGQVSLPAQVVMVDLDREAAPIGGCGQRPEGLIGDLGTYSVALDDSESVASLTHRERSMHG